MGYYLLMVINGINVGDALILSQTGKKIVRDAAGFPLEIPLLAPGRLDLTMDGKDFSVLISAEDTKSVLDYFALKGELVPIDCEHILQILADMKGVEESQLVKNDPILGEKAAAGFVSLVDRNGVVTAKVEKLTARAKELLTLAGDKVYGYFSPVIRGIKTAPLRFTSLSLTNTPAISNQDLLAACGVSKGTDLISVQTTNHGGTIMLEQLKKLAQALGMDVAALTAEKPEPVFVKALEEILALRSARDTFVGGIKTALALTDTDTLGTIAGKVLSLAEKAKGDTLSLTALQTRIADLEGKDKDRYVADLKLKGKLTEAMLPWAKTQDMAALIAWEKNAPVLVNTHRIVQPGSETGAADVLVMSDVDIDVAKKSGMDPKHVADVNKMKMPV